MARPLAGHYRVVITAILLAIAAALVILMSRPLAATRPPTFPAFEMTYRLERTVQGGEPILITKRLSYDASDSWALEILNHSDDPRLIGTVQTYDGATETTAWPFAPAQTTQTRTDATLVPEWWLVPRDYADDPRWTEARPGDPGVSVASNLLPDSVDPTAVEWFQTERVDPTVIGVDAATRIPVAVRDLDAGGRELYRVTVLALNVK